MIDIKNLSVNYGDFCAVDHISFHVNEKEIFGIIGLNGAGKTSTIECIEGLRKSSNGRIQICGLDPYNDREELSQKMGIQLQDTMYPGYARVNELCKLFSSFYPNPEPYEDLLKMLGIYEKRKSMISKLSGGQRQKLSIVLALISKPKVLFLDELTTGLDPVARHEMWDMILAMRDHGITIVLISHFMDEVQTICDRVAIMNKGKIVELGTTSEIVNHMNMKEKMEFIVEQNIDHLLEQLQQVSSVQYQGNHVVVYGKGDDFISTVIKTLDLNHITYHDIDIKKPGLEDAFLQIAEKSLEFMEEEVC